jgi:hypothetical protein
MENIQRSFRPVAALPCARRRSFIGSLVNAWGSVRCGGCGPDYAGPGPQVDECRPRTSRPRLS